MLLLTPFKIVRRIFHYISEIHCLPSCVRSRSRPVLAFNSRTGKPNFKLKLELYSLGLASINDGASVAILTNCRLSTVVPLWQGVLLFLQTPTFWTALIVFICYLSFSILRCLYIHMDPRIGLFSGPLGSWTYRKTTSLLLSR
jgi:hypothetical protein